VSHFHEVLREARRRAGLTQQSLAENAGIDHSYISKMETEEDTLPTRDITLKLAQALGIRRRTRQWITFLHEADVAGIEDLEGFTLVEVSEPAAEGKAASHVPDTASAERSNIVWNAKAEEIARLIASGNLDTEIQELVCDGIVEYSTRLLAVVELLQKTRVFSSHR
jgi:transcriptional regulator with XRE-family HTH domain